MPIHHLGGSFADNDQTNDDGLLGALAYKELFLAQAFDEAARIRRGLLHMVEIVSQAVHAHTG
jgi:hypothetical protein